MLCLLLGMSCRFLSGYDNKDCPTEIKTQFDKLKANRSQSKERKFVPKYRQKNLLGVFAMTVTTWAATMPVLVGILKQFPRLLFLLGEGYGARGEGGVSDPKYNQ